jgi:hypothetical protein
MNSITVYSLLSLSSPGVLTEAVQYAVTSLGSTLFYIFANVSPVDLAVFRLAAPHCSMAI